MSFLGLGSSNQATATIKFNADTKDAEKSLQNIGNTIKTVISVLAVREVAKFGLELMKIGSESSIVGKNFESMAKKVGGNSTEMMKQFRTATKGMISDTELQQRAIKALISGLDFKDMLIAMEYATKYAVSTGKNVGETISATLDGMARGTARSLYEVGINVKDSSDMMGDAVKQMKSKMDTFVSSTNDAAVRSGELAANIDNLKSSIGERLQPVFEKLLGITNSLVIGLGNLLNLGPKKDNTKKNIEETKNEILALEAALDNAKASGAAMVSWMDKNTKMRVERIAVAKAELKILKEDNSELEKMGQAPGKNPFAVAQTSTKAPKKDEDQKIELKSWEDWLKELELRNKNHAENLNEITQEQWDEMISIKHQAKIALLGEDQVLFDEQMAMFEMQKELYPQLTNEIYALQLQAVQENEKSILDAKLNAANQYMDSFSSINASMMTMIDAKATAEIEALEESGMSEEKIAKKKEKIMQEADKKRRVFARIQQGIAIGEAIIDAIRIGTSAAAAEPGGVAIKILTMIAGIAAGMAQVAVIQSQHFALGRIGDSKRSRQSDNIMAMLGAGETVISAPQTAMHQETLQAIQNNTANTARGMSQMGRGGIVNNFYGISTEQALQIQVDSKRKNSVGLRI